MITDEGSESPYITHLSKKRKKEKSINWADDTVDNEQGEKETYKRG